LKTSFLKRGAIALGGAALLLSATIGFTQAQGNKPTTAPTAKQQQHQAVLNLAATKLGLTGDQLSTAFKDARKDLGLNQGRVKAVEIAKDELTVAAKAIGLADLKALRTELAGTTLTAVAQKHGVAPSTVAAAITADVDARIQALVTSGKLSADRAAALKLKADARVNTFITREFKAPKATN
jgi:hypothetical protein